MKKLTLCVLILLVVVAFASLASAQTTIQTDGDVEAQGFIGDGSQVTEVDAQLLDGMDSADFAQETDLQSAEAMLAALQAQVNQLLACGSGRYFDHGDGTVLDCNTGLIWLKDASCEDLAGTDSGGIGNWGIAQSAAAALADGTCSLTDGSVAGAWRQPTISEFCRAWTGSDLSPCPPGVGPHSLIDSSLSGAPFVTNAASTGLWTEGDAFVGVQSFHYWSATESDAILAWLVSPPSGSVFFANKSNVAYVWPVRSGQ